MSELVFVMARKQNHFFVEIVGALRLELEKMGVKSSVSTSGFPASRRGQVYVLVPPHEFFALEGDVHRPDSRLLARTVFLCAEQPSTGHFDQNVHLAGSAGAIFDINAWAVAEFQRRGFRAQHLPLGYSEYWDHYAEQDTRDVDVAFLGAWTSRRARFLAQSGPILSRLNTRIVLTDNSGPNYSSKENFLVGTDKLELLRRSKAILNIHQGLDPYFEWQRVLEAIQCGCVVVTEHSRGYLPLVPGEHFVVGRPEVLATLVQEVVEDDGLRRFIRQRAYDFIRERLPLRRSAERLAEAADRVDRRAPVGGSSARPAPDRKAPAPVVETNPELVKLDSSMELVGMALKEIRLDLMEVRREQARARIAQVEGPPPSIRRVLASPAYSAQLPRVSVVTAVYNHAAWIGEALQSVEMGRFREFELIVVDDGSTDGSVDRVAAWSRERPHVPLLLLSHPVNRGLPRSRNAGVDFARGEYTFILDSDNDLFVNCLQRLVEALDGDPDASFAYGLLAAFRDGGEYTHLVSAFPWQPNRLRDGNYIDAMALFRTHILRAMGGYTTDRRLYGWEDYDLNCRMAETGRRAVFVPELVARYRVAQGSMLSITNLSSAPAMTALRERCPNLMTGGGE